MGDGTFDAFFGASIGSALGRGEDREVWVEACGVEKEGDEVRGGEGGEVGAFL